KSRGEWMRGGADSDAAGVSQRLKAGRQMGCIADTCLLSRRADACCASRNDETRGDTHTCLQRSSVGLPQPSDFLHDFQTGPNGALGRVLLRLRKTKIHEDAVTKVLRYMSFVFANRRYAGFAVLAQQPDQVFRIQLSSEHRGSNQINENHGELAALVGGFDGWSGSWLSSRVLRRCLCLHALIAVQCSNG